MDRKIERDVAPKRGQQNNISSGVFFVVVIVVVALILFLNIVYFYTPLLLLFFFLLSLSLWTLNGPYCTLRLVVPCCSPLSTEGESKIEREGLLRSIT